MKNCKNDVWKGTIWTGTVMYWRTSVQQIMLKCRYNHLLFVSKLTWSRLSVWDHTNSTFLLEIYIFVWIIWTSSLFVNCGGTRQLSTNKGAHVVAEFIPLHNSPDIQVCQCYFIVGSRFASVFILNIARLMIVIVQSFITCFCLDSLMHLSALLLLCGYLCSVWGMLL